MRFLEWGITKNHWLWFHCLAGAFLSFAWLKGLWFLNEVGEQEAVRNVFLIALVWEIGEFLWKQFITKWDNPDYKKRFFVDALFDILGALLFAFSVTLFI